MVEILLTYLLLAGSFSIASYFFIHIPALKQSNKKNGISYTIAYLLISFIYFPSLFYAWFFNVKLFRKELYSGRIS